MPFSIVRTIGGYYVKDIYGKKYSNKPIPRERAERQMRAIIVSENKRRKK